MAKDKKGFLLYCDLIHMVNKLPDETAGKLLKTILEYVNDLNPEIEDPLVDIAFEPVKQQLKRDLDRWESIRKKRSDAGKASAKKRQQKSTSVNKSEQVPTVNVNDTVNVTVNDKEDNIETVFLHWFNRRKEKHTGKAGKFRVLTGTDLNNLKKLKKGYTPEEFNQAAEAMFQKGSWAMQNQKADPSHFLRVENFNKYLNTEVKKKTETTYNPNF